MNWRTGLHKGRSHIIFAIALIVAGLYLVHLDDAQLAQKMGKACAVTPSGAPCPAKRERP